MFYDSTVICDGNFKKKAWALSYTNPTCKQTFTYNRTHMLLIMSSEEVVGFQLIKGKVISFDILIFLKAVIDRCRAKYPEKRISVVMDNATMHKTLYFKRFILSYGIKVLFTVRCHPLFNPVEFLIRFLKKECRKVYSAK